ncbi:MAG: TOBE domain-containing protein [Desulfovibrio sp.]|nr:TOBE domain-containing protein [Desulfovibrio sp.]
MTRLETGEVSARVELSTLQGLKVSVLVTIESVQRLGLAEGQLLAATVKAPFVMLDRECEARDGVNRFSGTVTSVNRGDVESSVVVDVDGGAITLCSILSTDELEGLGLQEGDRANVFFSPFAAVLSLPED